jgi:hypothetical protein
MIGGNSLAYTLLGLWVDALDERKVEFLIADPHYVG